MFIYLGRPRVALVSAVAQGRVFVCFPPKTDPPWAEYI